MLPMVKTNRPCEYQFQFKYQFQEGKTAILQSRQAAN